MLLSLPILSCMFSLYFNFHPSTTPTPFCPYLCSCISLFPCSIVSVPLDGSGVLPPPFNLGRLGMDTKFCNNSVWRKGLIVRGKKRRCPEKCWSVYSHFELPNSSNFGAFFSCANRTPEPNKSFISSQFRSIFDELIMSITAN
ncbi:unnamed protein product [Protopolystoma xenopodis]|uniref:Uncharacterized protein n=1 Tax=Protopolystoma xenopodis TaxID=117903 RepID=A0A3S5ADP2_9PLAT|nr:unnamed protein product [Protopolystoma xenopodis]